MTFKELLKQKMQEKSPDKPERNQAETYFIHSKDDFFHLDIERKFWSPKTAKDSYPKSDPTLKVWKPEEKIEKSSTESVIKEVLLSMNDLSTVEVLAVETLKKHEPTAFASGLIGPSGLKRLYRKLMRQHHPDLNPQSSPETVLEIKDAVDILEVRLDKVPSVSDSKAA